MKLRMRDDSLRLRLTRSEVDAFAKDGRVESRVTFGDKRLVYALAHSASAERATARLANDEILVLLPSPAARAWASSETVGIEATDGVLRILIEKDFACLKPREGEDDRDAFPHPKK
jgi:hypothetical protein